MRPRILIWGKTGEYRNYRRAVEDAGGEPYISQSREVEMLCRGVLLPGGGDIEPWRYGQETQDCRGVDPDRDASELALAGRFVERGLPVLGICRGMQVINVYLGGTLFQDIPGHGQQHSGVDGRHPVRTQGFSLCPGWCGTMAVNTAHHQAVCRLGEGLRAVQWAPDGVIEAMEHRTRPIWSVQWHPERLPGPAGAALLTAFVDRCR